MGAAIQPITQEDPTRPIYPFIWLDQSINTSKENLAGQKLIQSTIDRVKTFENVNSCEEYIRSISSDERIILIVSGGLGREITPKIHQLRQVSAIFVYCLDKSVHEQWAKQYKKIKGIMTKSPQLIEKLQLERSKRCQNEVNDPFSLGFYQADAYDERFIYSQLLIDVLLRTKPIDKDRNKFISYCREFSQDIHSELQLITQFQTNYSADQALDWYMKDSFLYRILNRILRLQNLEVIFFCRFILQDIRRAIKQNKCTSPIRVYRGQLMTEDEIHFLENSFGSLISVNSFLSTSIYRELALVFLRESSSSSDLQRVLLEIDADPSLTSIKPFGFITCNNSFRQTEEVVFTLGSIFRLNDLYQQTDGMWVLKLTLCADDDEEVHEIFKPFKNNRLSFGDYLRKIGYVNDAEKFFARSLNESFGTNQSTADCYYALGLIAMEKDSIDLSLNWHQKSLEIKLQILNEDHPSLVDSYNSIGQIYMKKNDYQQALTPYLRALKITMLVNGEKHPDVARCYTNIGGLYQKQGDYLRALECHEKALEILKTIHLTDHPDLGISHNNLAIIYSCRGQFDLALEHYKAALKILQNTLPREHPEIGVSYCGLGLISEQKGEFEIALPYYETTADIYRQTLSSTHPDLIQIEQHIQRILAKQRGL